MLERTPPFLNLNGILQPTPITPTWELMFPDEILKAPSHQRKARLAEFKKRLVLNKETFQVTVTDIVTKISQDPDVSEGLISIVWDHISHLDEDQSNAILEGIDLYITRHRKVQQLVKTYPQAQDMYEAFFGRQPNGDITLVQCPISIHFRCASISDYALIRSGAYKDKRDPTDLELAKASNTGGVFIADDQSTLLKNTRGLVTAENLEGGKEPSNTILEHEMHHAFMQLFQDAANNANAFHPFEYRFDQKYSTQAEIQEKFRRMSKQEKTLCMLTICRDERYETESRTRAEILAYLATNVDPTTIYQVLTLGETSGGIYDYFNASYIEQQKKHWKDYIQDPSSEEIIDNVVEYAFKEDYRRLIAESLASFEAIVGYGYSPVYILNLLSAEPLRVWRKVVKRMIATSVKNVA